MRIYPHLEAAILEIRRDLTRALPHMVHGVQQFRDRELESREALNYQYSIPIEEAVITDRDHFFKLFRLIKPETEEGILPWWKWLSMEVEARWLGGFKRTAMAAAHHPLEEAFREGYEPSYLYPHRIMTCGGFNNVIDLLSNDPTSRRAYIPIFHPEDSMRAAHQTRVPCSLGYHYIIRPDGQRDLLHATYLMRSCDFDTFWLMDVLIAARLAKLVADQLGGGHRQFPLKTGNLVHNVISFHMLRDVNTEGGEIY